MCNIEAIISMQLKREDHRWPRQDNAFNNKKPGPGQQFPNNQKQDNSFQKCPRLDIVSKNVDEEVEMLGQEVFVGDGNRHGTQLSKYFP